MTEEERLAWLAKLANCQITAAMLSAAEIEAEQYPLLWGNLQRFFLICRGYLRLKPSPCLLRALVGDWQWFSEYAFESAAGVLAEDDYPWTEAGYLAYLLVLSGSPKALAWLEQEKATLTQPKSPRLSQYDYLKNNNNHKKIVDHKWFKSCCADLAYYAAASGNFAILEWLKTNMPHLLPRERTATIAAALGQFDVLNWLNQFAPDSITSHSDFSIAHVAVGSSATWEVSALYSEAWISLAAEPVIQPINLLLCQWILEKHPQLFGGDNFSRNPVCELMLNKDADESRVLEVLNLLVAQPSAHDLFARKNKNHEGENVAHAIANWQVATPQEQEKKLARLAWLHQTYPELLQESNNCGETIAHMAAAQNDLALLDWVKTHCPVLLARTDHQGKNIAHVAGIVALSWIKNNEPLSLEHRAQFGKTLAHVAVEKGSLELLDWIKNNNPLLLEQVNDNGQTIAHHAVQYAKNPIEILTWINTNYPHLISQKDATGQTIAHLVAAYPKSYGVEYHCYEKPSKVGHVKQHDVLDWINAHATSVLVAPDQNGQTIAHIAARADLDYRENFSHHSALYWIKIHLPDLLYQKDGAGNTVLFSMLNSSEAPLEDLDRIFFYFLHTAPPIDVVNHLIKEKNNAGESIFYSSFRLMGESNAKIDHLEAWAKQLSALYKERNGYSLYALTPDEADPILLEPGVLYVRVQETQLCYWILDDSNKVQSGIIQGVDNYLLKIRKNRTHFDPVFSKRGQYSHLPMTLGFHTIFEVISAQNPSFLEDPFLRETNALGQTVAHHAAKAGKLGLLAPRGLSFKYEYGDKGCQSTEKSIVTLSSVVTLGKRGNTIVYIAFLRGEPRSFQGEIKPGDLAADKAAQLQQLLSGIAEDNITPLPASEALWQLLPAISQQISERIDAPRYRLLQQRDNAGKTFLDYAAQAGHWHLLVETKKQFPQLITSQGIILTEDNTDLQQFIVNRLAQALLDAIERDSLEDFAYYLTRVAAQPPSRQLAIFKHRSKSQGREKNLLQGIYEKENIVALQQLAQHGGLLLAEGSDCSNWLPAVNPTPFLVLYEYLIDSPYQDLANLLSHYLVIEEAEPLLALIVMAQNKVKIFYEEMLALPLVKLIQEKIAADLQHFVQTLESNPKKMAEWYACFFNNEAQCFQYFTPEQALVPIFLHNDFALQTYYCANTPKLELYSWAFCQNSSGFYQLKPALAACVGGRLLKQYCLFDWMLHTLTILKSKGMSAQYQTKLKIFKKLLESPEAALTSLWCQQHWWNKDPSKGLQLNDPFDFVRSFQRQEGEKILPLLRQHFLTCYQQKEMSEVFVNEQQRIIMTQVIGDLTQKAKITHANKKQQKLVGLSDVTFRL